MMKRLLLLAAALMISGSVAFAQEGPLPNKDTGTVNEMNSSPDQNQVLVGQRPSAGTGGSAGLVPDYSDRVAGQAHPAAAAQPNQGPSNRPAIAGNPGGMDQNSGAPLNDKSAVQAAKKGAAPSNSPEANPPAERVKKLTSSPGSAAATPAVTGDQSNETKQSREKKQSPK